MMFVCAVLLTTTTEVGIQLTALGSESVQRAQCCGLIMSAAKLQKCYYSVAWYARLCFCDKHSTNAASFCWCR